VEDVLGRSGGWHHHGVSGCLGAAAGLLIPNHRAEDGHCWAAMTVALGVFEVLIVMSVGDTLGVVVLAGGRVSKLTPKMGEVEVLPPTWTSAS
jgi:hypothetical protein